MRQTAPDSTGRNYTIGLLAAVGLHVLVLFGMQSAPPLFEPVEFAVESGEASVEVELIAALPAEEPAAVVEPLPPPPEPVPPPPPEPVPLPVEPPPPVPEKPPEMTLPEPAPTPPPKPRRIELPRSQKAQPKAKSAPRPIGDGSSPIPGNDATTARKAAGGDSSKASYLRNPHPQYPEAARAARQVGTVMLLVNVDAAGGVASVQITRSSGHALLDERARSTVSERWKFRPAKAAGIPVPSSVTVPVRFKLD